MIRKFLGVVKTRATSPKTMMVTGLVCGGVAIVMAHRAGRNVDETLDVNKEVIDNIKSLKGKTEIINEDGETVPYSDSQYRKDLGKAYGATIVDLGKLYLPVAAATAAEVILIVKGHHKQALQIASLTAAYECVDTAFKNYRANVVRKSGTDADKAYLLGLDTIDSVVVEEVNDETGQVETTKVKNLDVINDVSLVASPYAVDINYCIGGLFNEDPNYNTMVLKGYENIANTKLSQYGYLFLYEVYDMLGVTNCLNTEAIKASHVVGWLKGEGDDTVRFNMVLVPTKSGIIDGKISNRKEVGLIDFNCCGTIIDKI